MRHDCECSLGLRTPLNCWSCSNSGTGQRRPHIFRRGGYWWVNCKHGDRTGPYISRRGAFHAARDIAEGARP